MALTKKQQAFVEHYLREWNATRAAVLAGYSEKTARSIGSENLTKPDIAAAIQARLDELKMSADEVLLRLADQARATMDDFIDPERGEVDLARAAARGKLHLVKKFSRSTGKVETVTIELHDAQAALVQLGRHHKLFTDRTEIPGLDELKAYVGISPDEWDEVEDGEGGAGAPGAG